MDNLIFERVWEDAEFYKISIIAQSSCVQAYSRIYTTPELIKELADKLKFFPRTVEDRFVWENGEKGPYSAPCIILEFLCEDRSGHVGINVYLELEGNRPGDEQYCCFPMNAEPGYLNRFANALLRLNEPGIGAKAALIPEDLETVL